MKLFTKMTFEVNGRPEAVHYAPGQFNPRSPACQEDVLLCQNAVYILDEDGEVDQKKSAEARASAREEWLARPGTTEKEEREKEEERRFEALLKRLAEIQTRSSENGWNRLIGQEKKE
jgi:hypothetical protein